MSVLTWGVYAAALSVLLGLAALAFERACGYLRLPTRAAWAAALAGCVLLPLFAKLAPLPPLPVPLDGPVLVLPAITVEPVADGVRPGVAWAGAGWLALSALVLGLLAVAGLRLGRERRAWRRQELDGTELWVSPDTGPAVLGLLRQEIVVPEWVASLGAQQRRLLLAHEREHARAGDARLVTLAWLAIVAMPWNPLVWWQVARLRRAVELDCDARVLAGGEDRHAYGTLLLDVGRRQGLQPLLGLAFAERPSLLETRIRALVAAARARRPVRAVLFALLGVGLLGTAYCVRDPLASGSGGLPPAPEPGLAEIEAGPTFTPFTVRPELHNAKEVRAELERHYPPLLRAAGLGGRATVWLLIGEDGVVRRQQLRHGSGQEALDAAALRVASHMRFSPARHQGRTVPVWIEVPVVFASGDAAPVSPPPSRTSPAVPATPAPRPGSVAEKPTFTPMTDRPELLNPAEVQAALAENYPPALREAGIGGMATVWFFIGADGSVSRALLSRSSERPELDQAALAVAGTMRFTPARNRGEKVAVWVELPIVFAAK